MSTILHGYRYDMVIIDDPFFQSEVRWVGVCTCCMTVHTRPEVPKLANGPNMSWGRAKYAAAKCQMVWAGGCHGMVVQLPRQKTVIASYLLGGVRAVSDLLEAKRWDHRMGIASLCRQCLDRELTRGRL